MGFVLMIMLALIWGFVTATVIKNTLTALIVAGVGGYLIGTAFQHFGLLGA